MKRRARNVGKASSILTLQVGQIVSHRLNSNPRGSLRVVHVRTEIFHIAGEQMRGLRRQSG